MPVRAGWHVATTIETGRLLVGDEMIGELPADRDPDIAEAAR
jgi:hypothetical protein